VFLGLGLLCDHEDGRPTPRTRRVLTHRPLSPPYGPEILKFLRRVSEADTLRKAAQIDRDRGSSRNIWVWKLSAENSQESTTHAARLVEEGGEQRI
jgi:hypothetical protein